MRNSSFSDYWTFTKNCFVFLGTGIKRVLGYMERRRVARKQDETLRLTSSISSSRKRGNGASEWDEQKVGHVGKELEAKRQRKDCGMLKKIRTEADCWKQNYYLREIVLNVLVVGKRKNAVGREHEKKWGHRKKGENSNRKTDIRKVTLRYIIHGM